VKRLVIAAAAFLVGLGGAWMAASLSTRSEPRPNGELLGDADFTAHCHRNFGEMSVAVLDRPDAFGWRCASRPNGIFATIEVDVDALCNEQFGSPAYANAWDTKWPYSWECFYGNRK
jgi:hypothetical protein